MGFPETYSWMVVLVMTAYGFMTCAFTIGLIRILKKKTLPAALPGSFVSVIIPVRNEASHITGILEEMLAQDFPADCMEVIVADDHSEDETMVLAGRFAGFHTGFRLRLVPSPHTGLAVPGKKRAIERAVSEAKGEILLFTDADTRRGSGWISSMVSDFTAHNIQMVLGPVYYCKEKNPLQKIQSLEFLGLMGTTAGSAALDLPVMCNGANLAYRRSAFIHTGGFSGNLRYGSGDDQFVMSSVRSHYGKGSVVFNPDPLAAVATEPEATLGGFFNQRLRWVSKSRGYRDPVVIMVGITVYLTHLLLLAGMLLGFFYPALLLTAMMFWLVKILLEYPVVRIMMRFFGKEKLTGYYFIAQVFQLVYVPLAGLLGLFVPYRWKGRRG